MNSTLRSKLSDSKFFILFLVGVVIAFVTASNIALYLFPEYSLRGSVLRLLTTFSLTIVTFHLYLFVLNHVLGDMNSSRGQGFVVDMKALLFGLLAILGALLFLLISAEAVIPAINALTPMATGETGINLSEYADGLVNTTVEFLPVLMIFGFVVVLPVYIFIRRTIFVGNRRL